MFWSMSRRAIAATVAFLIGWTLFHIVRPLEKVESVSPPAREITSITLKRLGCTDVEMKCPVYEVTFRRDGTATYNGYANDEYIGEYTGTVEYDEFLRLAEQIEKQRFFELPLYYDTSSVEENIKFEVITNQGRRMVTTYNWASTPVELRVLHALVEEQAYHVYWEKEEAPGFAR